MKRLVLTSLAVAGLVSAPIPAAAQHSPVAPQTHSLWDGAVKIGLVSGQRRDLNEYSPWYEAGSFSIDMGRYLTPHLKATIDLGRSGEGRLYSQRQAIIPGQPGPVFVYEEHFLRRTQLSAAVSYQFLENSWVHPFVTGGVQHTWEQDRVRTPGLPVGRLIPAPTESVTHARIVRPFVGVGAKFYLSSRTFARGELQIAPGSNRAHVTTSGGIGVDFGKASGTSGAGRAGGASKEDAPPVARTVTGRDARQTSIWREFAKQLVPGAAIRLRLTDGSTVKAALLQATDAGITIQPKTRVAVDVRNVDYASIASIELDGQQGLSTAKAIGIGVASGAAALAGMLFIMFASISD